MPKRSVDLADYLRAQIERADALGHRYYCERCRAFVARRKCRFRHRGRYWRLDQLRAIPDKLASGASLTVDEMLFVETLRERADL
jgi:hypothetical protein